MIIDDEKAAAILAPLEGGVGIDGRADENAPGDLFRELRFQRKAVFRSELRASMGEDSGDPETWTWPALAEVAGDYLAQTGKDLEPMAILIEASTRIDGLPGLDRAMNLLADFIELYWEQGLYPPEDEEDGVDARFHPLSGLSGGSGDKDGTLVMPLRRIVLGGDTLTGELRYFDRVMADAQFAASQSSTAENRAELAQEAEDALAAAEALARRLSARVLREAIARLNSAEAGWRRANSFIAERTKPRFPSTSRVTDELRAMREWLENLLQGLPDDGSAEESENEAGNAEGGALTASAGATSTGGPMVIGNISNRGDALRAVTAAADYFDRFEPLSPLGPTLREVDRRARLSLAALLEELIPDESVRETYYWRSGIKPPQPSVSE